MLEAPYGSKTKHAQHPQPAQAQLSQLCSGAKVGFPKEKYWKNLGAKAGIKLEKTWKNHPENPDEKMM